MTIDWTTKTLPDVCMDLHMCHTGASDLSPEDYAAGVSYLTARVALGLPTARRPKRPRPALQRKRPLPHVGESLRGPVDSDSPACSATAA